MLLILVRLVLALSVALPHVVEGSSPTRYLLPECERCSFSYQCRPGHICYAGRCINYQYFYVSIVRCLPSLDECSACMSRFECASLLCESRKCVKRGSLYQESSAKCHPLLAGECGECSSPSQCRSGLCIKRRCIRGDQVFVTSLRKCFTRKPKCSECGFSFQCAGYCSRGRCRNAPLDVCPGKKDCENCAPGEECISGYCYRGKCVTNSSAGPESICYGVGKECEFCDNGLECESGFCGNGRCLATGRKLRQSSSRCNPALKPVCQHCINALECSTGLCIQRRCVGPGVRC